MRQPDYSGLLKRDVKQLFDRARAQHLESALVSIEENLCRMCKEGKGLGCVKKI